MLFSIYTTIINRVVGIIKCIVNGRSSSSTARSFLVGWRRLPPKPPFETTMFILLVFGFRPKLLRNIRNKKTVFFVVFIFYVNNGNLKILSNRYTEIRLVRTINDRLVYVILAIIITIKKKRKSRWIEFPNTQRRGMVNEKNNLLNNETRKWHI